MAEMEKGILGGISGAVGTVVGAIVHGKSIIRSKPKKSTKAPKAGQLSQRQKFSVATDFVFQNQSIMSIGYQSPGGTLSPINAAVSYNLKNAVTGTYPSLKVDYTAVRTSKEKGGLESYGTADIVMAAGFIANLTWDPVGSYTTEQLVERSLDQGIFLLHDETNNLSLFSIGAVTRGEGSLSIHLPKAFKGTLHSWFFFVSVDGKVSKSQYIGPRTALT